MPNLIDKLIDNWNVEFEFDESAVADLLGDTDSESYPILRQEELAALGTPEIVAVEFRNNGTTVSEGKEGVWELVREREDELTIKVGENSPSRYVTFVFPESNTFHCYDSLKEILPTTGSLVVKSVFS